MDVRELDPEDDAAMAAWHATYLASSTHEREHATPWMLEEMRAELRADDPSGRKHAWAGVLDGEVATTGWAEMSLRDNLQEMYVEVQTHPDHRGRGHGSTMLEHLVAHARAVGRSLLTAEAAYPYDAPADGAGHPYVEFLTRRGFRFGIGDVQRVLDLPVADELLEAMLQQAAPHHTAYTLRSFAGPVPDDLIDSFAALVGHLMTDAPTGEMELEPEEYDAERVRDDERTLAEQGRTKYTTVALTADGTVAAYTDVAVPRHDPGRAFQWGTLVQRDHRGHRLGMAVKARNLRLLQAEQPDLRLLSTYNAEVNEHMVAVNELLGFRPVERLGEFQRRLT